MKSMRSVAVGAVVGALLAACSTPPVPRPQPVARVTPPTDCKAWVGTDRNGELPGYLLRQGNGAVRCVPLLVTGAAALVTAGARDDGRTADLRGRPQDLPPRA